MPVTRREKTEAKPLPLDLGFQTRRWHDGEQSADFEIGDTAGLETCGTMLQFM